MSYLLSIAPSRMSLSKPWSNSGGMASLSGRRGYQAPDSNRGFDGSPFTTTGTKGFSDRGDRLHAAIDSLKDFFGVPPNRVDADTFNRADDFYEQESNDYPEAFKIGWGDGQIRNGHLSRVLMEKTEASESPYITILAPWEFAGDDTGLKYSWSLIKFNQAILDREPEEAVPRLLNNTRASGSASMVRYGIAMLLEVNFAETRIGREMFRCNIEQIRIATVETASYGALVNMLEHPRYEDIFDARENDDGYMTRHQLDAYFKEQNAQWGILHKDRDGLDHITSKLAGRLADLNGGQRGNAQLIAAGIGQYVKNSRENKFYLDGANAAIDAVRTLGIAVWESRAFSQGEHQPRHDPMFRPQTIGDHMTLDDQLLLAQDVKDYHTDHMDSYGYSEDSDDLERFRYRRLYTYSGVWDFSKPDAPVTDKLGKYVLYDMGVYTWGQAYKKHASFDRVVDKLVQLPADKQRECVSSMHVLDNTPDNDVNFIHPKGLDFFPEPFGHDERNVFDRLLSEDGVKMSTDIFTVAERRAYDREREMPGVYGMSKGAQAYDAYVERNNKKRPAPPETLDEVFNQAEEVRPKDIDAGDADVPFASNDVERMEVANGFIAKYPAQKKVPQIRRIRRTQAHREVGRDEARILKEKIDELKKITRDEACQKHIETAANRVRDMLHLSLDQRVSLLSQMFAVLKEAESKSPGAAFTTDRIDSALVGTFYPTLATVQFEPLLSLLDPSSLTPLEHAILRDSEPAAPRAPEVVRPGWFSWNAPALPGEPPEDGVLKLLAFPGEAYHGIPLAHDALAITYAANAIPLFRVPHTAPALKNGFQFDDFIQRGVKRDRANRLALAVVTSVLFHMLYCQGAPRVDYRDWVHHLKASTKLRLQEALELIPVGKPTMVASQGYLQDAVAHVVQFLRTELLKPVKEMNDIAFEAIPGQGTLMPDLFNTLLRTPLTKLLPSVAKEQRQVPVTAAAPGLVWNKKTVADLVERASIASGSFYRFCVENHVPVPFALHMTRPNMTYMMGCIMRTIGGPNGAAKTLYKKPNFMLAANAAQKMFYGHYTFYNTTVVFRPEMIAIAENVYCGPANGSRSGYLGGAGVSVWNPLNDAEVNQYKEGNIIRDMFVVLWPMNRARSASSFPWLTITGVMPSSLSVAPEVNAAMWYEGCTAWSRFWGWNADALEYKSRKYSASAAVDEEARRYNVLTFQGLQIKYIPEKGWEGIILNKGPWGENVYPGCGKVRAGQTAGILVTPGYIDKRVVTLN